MIDYYRRKPDHVHKAEAMEKGQTLIYYTFARPPEGFEIYEDIIGVWKNTDRDLPVYINSIMTFGEDNSWTHELTPENVDFMVNAIKNVEQFQDMTEAERREYVESRNPQTGSYHFIFDALVIEYDNAIGGRKGITGQASVKSIVLTIRFDTPKNMEEQGKLYPDLHFIRVDDTPE
jgi:hypothetical protein